METAYLHFKWNPLDLMMIIRIKTETFINLKGVDSNMSGMKGVTVGMEDPWDTTEAEQLYKKLFGMDKEYHYADPGRDWTVEKAERSKQLGGIEINTDIIRNYNAKSICRHCWALRTLGSCIYGLGKVKHRKTVWKKKWERRVIKHENEPSVVPIFTGAGDPKYYRMKKKIYKLYRKGVFRSRWTLYKLLNQLEDKFTKWDIEVSTWYEEKWIFKGWEAIPIEFELVCPLRILFGSADFLALWERDQWDFEPPHSLRRRKWGVGHWDDREENDEFIEIADHFVDQVIWDDDDREYQEEDRIDNSETIDEETEETNEQRDKYVCDNCDLKHSCEYAFDPYCKFECLADK